MTCTLRPGENLHQYLQEMLPWDFLRSAFFCGKGRISSDADLRRFLLFHWPDSNNEMEDNGMYSVKVRNVHGHDEEIEVSEEVYELFQSEIRNCERVKKEKSRHLAKDAFDENKLPHTRKETPEDLVCLSDSLHLALQDCTSMQRERFRLYLQGYSYSEIAFMQHCRKQSVRASILEVTRKVKKFL